jgi:thiamine biosynthesis lipoprotein
MRQRIRDAFPMSMKFSRRRVVTLIAAAAGLPLLGYVRNAQARPVHWEGTAMGTRASLTLHHPDEALARRAIEAAVAELRRLEGQFSLFRADSALSTLNRDGVLTNASDEFLALAGEARRYAELTGGAFDPTVQPVWRLYFGHFMTERPDPAGPSSADLARAVALVDWRGLDVDAVARRVSLARPGMGVTFNGIAQGFVTDRVGEVLKAHGLERMLVDMGEPRAHSTRPDGTAWRIGIADPGHPERGVATLEVVDKAVATSGGYGTLFDAEGRFTHLVRPEDGSTAPARRGVTVVADTAAKADALSTALSVAPTDRRAAIVEAAGGIEAHFVAADGAIAKLAS